MHWEDTVKFDKLHPAMVLAALRVDAIISPLGVVCWITSANDRVHMTNSKHYEGKALDFRTHAIPQDRKKELLPIVKSALGPQFTVLFEDEGTPNEHLHVEFLGD